MWEIQIERLNKPAQFIDQYNVLDVLDRLEMIAGELRDNPDIELLRREPRNHLLGTVVDPVVMIEGLGKNTWTVVTVTYYKGRGE